MSKDNGAYSQRPLKVYLCRAENSCSFTHTAKKEGLRTNESLKTYLERQSLDIPVEIETVCCVKIRTRGVTHADRKFVHRLRASAINQRALYKKLLPQNSAEDSHLVSIRDLRTLTCSLFGTIVSSKHAIPWLKDVSAGPIPDMCLSAKGIRIGETLCFTVGASTASILKESGFARVQTLNELRAIQNEMEFDTLSNSSSDLRIDVQNKTLSQDSALIELLRYIRHKCVANSVEITSHCFPSSKAVISYGSMEMHWLQSTSVEHDPQDSVITYHMLYPCGDNSVLFDVLPKMQSTGMSTKGTVLLDDWTITVGEEAMRERKQNVVHFRIVLHYLVVYHAQYGIFHELSTETQNLISKKKQIYGFIYVLYSAKIAQVVLQRLARSRGSSTTDAEKANIMRNTFICVGRSTANFVKKNYSLSSVSIVENHSDLKALADCIIAMLSSDET